MQYQLPTGKVINLTIEEYLNLTDDDINFLIASNLGDYPNSQWDGSVIKTSNKQKYVNKDIDYEIESDEVPLTITTISINTLTVDELESLEDADDSSEEDS